MKICVLHQPGDPYSLMRIRRLVDLGHRVTSITLPRKARSQAHIEGVRHIPLEPNFFSRFPFAKRFIYFAEIKRITNGADILHIVSALNSFYLLGSDAKANVLELEGSDVIQLPKRHLGLSFLYRHLFQHAQALVCDSQIAANSVYELTKQSRKASIIEIGLDLSIYSKNINKGHAREKLEIGDNFLIFHSRGLSPVYNVASILEAIPLVVKQVKNICFIFTGDPTELDLHTQSILKNQVLSRHVRFVGRLDHEKEMKYFYRDADLVLSTPLSDSSPFSVYEAMSQEVPVIATDLSWIEGKFIRGRHLQVVPLNDYKALADMIIEMLKGNVATDTKGARQIIERKFDSREETKKLSKLYSELV